MAAPVYTVTATQPYTYQDKIGQIVSGYRVWFNVTEYNETFFVNVPTLDPETVKAKIMAIVQGRKALDA